MSLTRGTIGDNLGLEAADPDRKGTSGIHNAGIQVADTCTKRRNGVADGQEAGWGAGGIHNDGELTLTDSTVSANSGLPAGGIFNRGDLILVKSTVSGNTGNAGGLRNHGSLTLRESTTSGNWGYVEGGGLMNDGWAAIRNATLADNRAQEPNYGAGIHNTASGELRLLSTIVARQQAGPDCVGTILSEGWNLDSDGSCALDGTRDQTADPRLYVLSDYGGPTFTHALMADSPARDNGRCRDFCGLESTADQRGFARPFGDYCDIGAYEYHWDPNATTLSGLAAGPTAPAAGRILILGAVLVGLGGMAVWIARNEAAEQEQGAAATNREQQPGINT